MTSEELLRGSFVTLEVNDDFTEARVTLRDYSGLYFCHRVGERWARAVLPDSTRPALAGELLARITRFRLNGKHLDVQFQDGSRWEARFGGSRDTAH